MKIKNKLCRLLKKAEVERDALRKELEKWKCAAHWNKHDEDNTEHSGACDSYGICNACAHDYAVMDQANQASS